MSGAGIYSPDNYERIFDRYTRPQRVKGGLTRIRTGKRHPLYKFFVKDDTVSTPVDYVHGSQGGKARVVKALRDEHGRFVKEQTKW